MTDELNERRVLLDDDGYQLDVFPDCDCKVIQLCITPTSGEPELFTIDSQKADLTLRWIENQINSAMDVLAKAQRAEKSLEGAEYFTQIGPGFYAPAKREDESLKNED